MSSLNEVANVVLKEPDFLQPSGKFESYMSSSATKSLVYYISLHRGLWQKEHHKFGDHAYAVRAWKSILATMDQKGHFCLYYAVKSWQNIRRNYFEKVNEIDETWSVSDQEVFKSLNFLRYETNQSLGDVLTQDDVDKLFGIGKIDDNETSQSAAQTSEETINSAMKQMNLAAEEKMKKLEVQQEKQQKDQQNSEQHLHSKTEAPKESVGLDELPALISELRELVTELKKPKVTAVKEIIMEALKEFEEQKKVQETEEKKKVARAVEKFAKERKRKLEENRKKESQRPEDWTDEKEKKAQKRRVFALRKLDNIPKNSDDSAKLQEKKKEASADANGSMKSADPPVQQINEQVTVDGSQTQEKAEWLKNVLTSFEGCQLCNKEHNTWPELKAHKKICLFSEKFIAKEAREQTPTESAEDRIKKIYAYRKAMIAREQLKIEANKEAEVTLKSEGVKQSTITAAVEEGLKSKKVRWFIGPKTEITVANKEEEKATVAVEKATLEVGKATVGVKINKEEIPRETEEATKEEIGIKPKMIEIRPVPNSYFGRRCDICEKVYSTESVLLDHKKNMHEIYEVKKVKEFMKTPKYETYEKLGHRCDICNIPMDSYFALAGHKEIKHGIMPNGYKSNQKSATTGFGGIKKTANRPKTAEEVSEMVEKKMSEEKAMLWNAKLRAARAQLIQKDKEEKESYVAEVTVTKEDKPVKVALTAVETTVITEKTKTIIDTPKEEAALDEQATVTQTTLPVTVTQEENLLATTPATADTVTTDQNQTTLSRSGQDDFLTFSQFFVFIFPAIMIIILLNFF